MSEYLFAYGTLQPGLAPAEIADVVAGFEIAGVGFVHGTLYDLGSFPGRCSMRLHPAGFRVRCFDCHETRTSSTGWMNTRSTIQRRRASARSSAGYIQCK